ncbi:MAG: response regulator transcription factor [Chloroflexales bacterium]|nr:response regulator transcription factor [Chloroflexales bacterium]
MRVVIVEAQLHVRTALLFLLQQQPDLEVLCAFGPAPDLVARVLALRPEVILLDWEMPRRLAAQVLAAIRRLPAPPRVVVLVTRTEDEADAVAAGAQTLVSKGEPPNLVLRAIRGAYDLDPLPL